ncbi:MAG: hypothetical protein A2020_09930 [Lentisphaerae bacterium GWF2_45_14]|nr:MAG: hypothetical protein A2020_09930 [Lentisphaerae bacterium GWF2_45_14]
MAVKQFQSWRSVYTMVPLSKELLMGLCEYAGVHVYSKSFDVLYANKSYITLHAITGGTKTISLQGKFKVLDGLTGKIIATDVREFSDDIPVGETKIYKLVK